MLTPAEALAAQGDGPPGALIQAFQHRAVEVATNRHAMRDCMHRPKSTSNR
jgi:hypothetical protein